MRYLMLVLVLCSVLNGHALAQQADAQNDKFVPVKTINFNFNNIINDNCAVCELAGAMTRAMVNYGKLAFDKVQQSLLALLGMFLGVFMLYKAAKPLLPFGGGGGKQSFNEMTSMIVIVLLAGAALQSMNIYWKYIFIPVASAGISISNVVTRAVNVNAEKCDMGGAGGDINALAAALGDKVACQIKQVATVINKGLLVGVSNILGSFPELRTDRSFWERLFDLGKSILAVIMDPAAILAKFIGVLSGIGIIVVYFFMLFVMLFGMIEVMFRWCLVSVLSPLMIAAFPLKQTRGFSTFGLKGLVESAVTFVIMAVIAGISITLLNEIQISVNDQKMTVAQIAERVLQKEAQYVVLYPWTGGFWQVMMIGFISITVMMKAHEFSSALIGAGISGFTGELAVKIANLNTALAAANTVYKGAATASGAVVAKVTGQNFRASEGFTRDLSQTARQAGSAIRDIADRIGMNKRG